MKGKSNDFLRGLVITVIVFAVLLASGYVLLNRVSKKTSDAETELVRRAVRSAALTCYSVEGYYPSNLDYLKEHYGLIYDDERYIVVYDAFASNLIPDISVLEKGAAG